MIILHYIFGYSVRYSDYYSLFILRRHFRTGIQTTWVSVGLSAIPLLILYPRVYQHRPDVRWQSDTAYSWLLRIIPISRTLNCRNTRSGLWPAAMVISRSARRWVKIRAGRFDWRPPWNNGFMVDIQAKSITRLLKDSIGLCRDSTNTFGLTWVYDIIPR